MRGQNKSKVERKEKNKEIRKSVNKEDREEGRIKNTDEVEKKVELKTLKEEKGPKKR